MPGGEMVVGMPMEEEEEYQEQEQERKSVWQRIKAVLADTPASAEYTLFFGVGGLLVSCAVAIYCYRAGINRCIISSPFSRSQL